MVRKCGGQRFSKNRSPSERIILRWDVKYAVNCVHLSFGLTTVTDVCTCIRAGVLGKSDRSPDGASKLYGYIAFFHSITSQRE
jgi:hypothetical protein